MKVLYDMNFPLDWSERPARVQASCCKVWLLFLSVGKKSGPMNARVFIVVAVILLFKNAETPGAFLRHQVVSKFEPTILCDIRSWGTSTWFGPAPSDPLM